jgi:hypothetical protein
MHRFIEGSDRAQASLLPASLEDYVDADNPVRVIAPSLMRWIWIGSALR